MTATILVNVLSFYQHYKYYAMLKLVASIWEAPYSMSLASKPGVRGGV